jgi:hypothetical protein
MCDNGFRVGQCARADQEILHLKLDYCAGARFCAVVLRDAINAADESA